MSSQENIGGRERRLGKMVLAYLLGVVFGYPILTIGSLFLGVQSPTLSIVYRLVFLSLGIFLIVNSVLLRGGLRFIKAGLPFLFFWVIYGLVLINDISVEGIRMGRKSEFYLYSFAFGSSMMTFVTLFFSGYFLKFDKKALSQLFGVTLFANILIVLYLFKNGGVSVEALAYRASVDTDSGNVLNPITIGQFGVFGVVSAAGLMMREERSIISIVVAISAMAISVCNVFLGASRGPILVGAIVLLLIVYYYGYSQEKTSMFVLKVWAYFCAAGAAFYVFVIPFVSATRISVFSRIREMFHQKLKGEKEIRDYEWESAIVQFKEHPVLGDKYINDFDNYYPHNVYLEVLMSTGIIGGFLFFIGLSIVLYRILVVYHSKSVVRFAFATVVVAILLFRATSGALHQAPDFWAALGIIVSMKMHEKNG